AFTVPNWAFCEFEPLRQLEDLRVRRNDLVERRIFANDFNIYFARRDSDWHRTAFVKLELRLAHVAVIGRRVPQRAVCPENRELDFLSWLNAAVHDQSIRRVPTFDNRAAALSKRARHLTIYPDFSVIID